MITYQALIWEEDQILNLYLDNKWYNYTNNKELLFQGIKQSQDVLAAYDKDLLVGLIRTVGDGTTLCYILDILVLEKYHRKGIGTELIHRMINKYEDCLHIMLTTDTTEKTIGFYRSLGFKSYSDMGVMGFRYSPLEKE